MKLTISIAQIAVARAKPEENLKKGERLIAEAARRGSGIICFPEMWTTGFNWAANERIARDHEEIIDRIGALAKEHKIWISSPTLALNDDGKTTNAHTIFDANGKRLATYRKTHLFSMLREDKHMTRGDELCLVDTPWGKAGLSVCYDLRFPELFRTYALKGARMIFSPMAMPRPRIQHWKVLIRARAIESQLYMVGVNQVGTEDFGKGGSLEYFGDSCIIDPWGEAVLEAGESEEKLATAIIDMAKVDEIRSKMAIFKDRRPELYDLA